MSGGRFRDRNRVGSAHGQGKFFSLPQGRCGFRRRYRIGTGYVAVVDVLRDYGHRLGYRYPIRLRGIELDADGARDAVDAETISGAFDVYPVQPPRALSDPGPFEFAPPDPKYYGSTYPGEIVVAGHQGSMFGYNIASVFVAPVQYSGTDRSLVFHPRVRFTLELEPADLGYLRPGNRSPEARRRVEAQIASIVLNPQDVAACAP